MLLANLNITLDIQHRQEMEPQ